MESERSPRGPAAPGARTCPLGRAGRGNSPCPLRVPSVPLFGPRYRQDPPVPALPGPVTGVIPPLLHPPTPLPRGAGGTGSGPEPPAAAAELTQTRSRSRFPCETPWDGVPGQPHPPPLPLVPHRAAGAPSPAGGGMIPALPGTGRDLAGFPGIPEILVPSAGTGRRRRHHRAPRWRSGDPEEGARGVHPRAPGYE